MWKYIVTWTLIQSVACPPSPPDEFGRQSMTINSIACVETIYKTREFTNRDSAIAFHDRGNYAMPNNFEIDSVRIDSLKLNSNDKR